MVEVITGRDPLTGNGIAVTVRDGMIAQLARADYCGDLWLTAGLVDLQVNGYRGLDLNSDAMNAATVSALALEMLRTGVTGFAPTLITASQQQMLARLRCISVACATDPITAESVVFVHLEGPNISALDGYRGAHPLEQVRPPSLDEFDALQEASGNRIGMVTLSPHFEDCTTYIQELVSQGVLVSIGHTHASTEEIHAAVEAGASLSTHLGNAVAPLLARHPNPIWSQMDEGRLQAMLIADGHHLSPEVFRVMLRVKSSGRSILVSDLVALAGMAPGKYTAPIGGEVELTTDGRLCMAGTKMLAGAAMPLIDCIGRAVEMSGLPLSAVLQMANANPGGLCALMGEDRGGHRGKLEIGERADLLQFRWEPNLFQTTVENVWLAGSHVYPG